MYIEEIDLQGVLRSEHARLRNDLSSAPAETSTAVGLEFCGHETVVVPESEAA